MFFTSLLCVLVLFIDLLNVCYSLEYCRVLEEGCNLLTFSLKGTSCDVTVPGLLLVIFHVTKRIVICNICFLFHPIFIIAQDHSDDPGAH